MFEWNVVRTAMKRCITDTPIWPPNSRTVWVSSLRVFAIQSFFMTPWPASPVPLEAEQTSAFLALRWRSPKQDWLSWPGIVPTAGAVRPRRFALRRSCGRRARHDACSSQANDMVHRDTLRAAAGAAGVFLVLGSAAVWAQAAPEAERRPAPLRVRAATARVAISVPLYSERCDVGRAIDGPA